MSDTRSTGISETRRFWGRLILAGIVIAAAMTGADIAVTSVAEEAILRDAEIQVRSLALMSAQQVRGEDLEKIHTPADMGTPEFKRTHAMLTRLRLMHPDIAYIYTMRYTGEGEQWSFIVDADPYSSDMDGDGIDEIDDLGTPTGQLYEAGPEFHVMMLRGLEHSSADILPVADEWGTFVSGYAPVRTADGRVVGLLGVDVRWERILAKQEAVSTAVILLSVIVGMLLWFAFYLFLRRTQAFDAVVALQTQLEQVKAQFSRFVPDNVRRELERNPDASKLERSEKDVTIMFADLAGYTQMSEQLTGEAIGEVVEHYFSRYLEVIQLHRGQVNETAGDGLMIIFDEGGPEAHALAAVRAGIDLLEATHEVNASIREGDDSLPSELLELIEPVKVNIGINSGTAWVGLSTFEGLSGVRYTYTATGTVTNVAARIGSMARDGDILMSEETAHRVESEIPLLSLGKHRFKNVSREIEVFRPKITAEDRDQRGLEQAQPTEAAGTNET